jgi:hypothetical protein
MEQRSQNSSVTSSLHNQTGSLSVTALWMLALLALIAAGLGRHAVIELRLDNYALRAAEAKWLARAGVRHAMAVLKMDAMADSINAWDALTDAWACSPERFKQVPCGNGFFAVGYAVHDEYPGLREVYGMVDENRKINLNRAPADILLRLPGMNPEKIAALLDWRDRDDVPGPGGAEAPYYLALWPAYRCKDADLDFVEEVELVRGFTPEDVQRLQPLVTVYGDGQVNINTAAVNVLQALGLRPELARSIVALRWGADREPFTGDDIVFKNPFEIAGALHRLTPLAPDDQMMLNRLAAQGLLGVTSSHFSINAVGVTMGGEVRQSITAIVHRLSRDRVNIVSWKE